MKRKLKYVAALFIVSGLVLTSCTKVEEEEEVKPTTVYRANDDASRTEFDKAQEDIDEVIKSSSYTGNQRVEAVNLPCGSVTVDTNNPNNFTITYGQNCGARVLSGSISVTLVPGTGTKFSDAGAKLKIVFNDYKVHYNSSGEEIIYNGTTYTTNVSGGRLSDVFTSTSAVSIVHKTRGTLTLTYDTSSTTAPVQRVWNLFRKKTFATTGAANYTGVSLTFEGDTTVADTTVNSYINSDFTNVSEYGTDVKGRKFVHTIPTAFKWSYCSTGTAGVNNYRLKQGKVVHTSDASAIFPADFVYEFIATAGYKLSGTTPVLDGDCGSTGYLMEGHVKNATTGNTSYGFSAYQSY